jgi:hypothetical protein
MVRSSRCSTSVFLIVASPIRQLLGYILKHEQSAMDETSLRLIAQRYMFNLDSTLSNLYLLQFPVSWLVRTRLCPNLKSNAPTHITTCRYHHLDRRGEARWEHRACSLAPQQLKLPAMQCRVSFTVFIIGPLHCSTALINQPRLGPACSNSTTR